MVSKIRTIGELLQVTTEFFKKKDIDSPRLDAEVLLAFILNTDRVQLYLNFDKPLSDREISEYRSTIKRRIAREPVQYITGKREFWSLEFSVGPQVLVPRPESELLVEKAIGFCRSVIANKDPFILDIGTGCGVLAVSIASELEGARIWASDISEGALETARLNAKKHHVDAKIRFLSGDLWAPVVKLNISFDVIVSNPPYIATEDLDSLPPEVRLHEPESALDGHEEGLFYIEKIIKECHRYLNPGGCLILEMDPEQTPRAVKWLEEAGTFEEIKRFKDYSHNYRVVIAREKQDVKKH